MTSICLPTAQTRILFERGQPLTSSVTGVALIPTVPPGCFLTVENRYEVPVKFLAGLFRKGHAAKSSCSVC